MKTIKLLPLLVLAGFAVFGQTPVKGTLNDKSPSASVEKSVFGIQMSLSGIWGHNETKLTNQVALRSEIGFDSGIWGGDFYDKIGFLMTPVIIAEPRWYYNLNKRVKKSKRIDGNSGNFISINTSYHPNWFVISNYEDIRVISDISIVPTWGNKTEYRKTFQL